MEKCAHVHLGVRYGKRSGLQYVMRRWKISIGLNNASSTADEQGQTERRTQKNIYFSCYFCLVIV